MIHEGYEAVDGINYWFCKQFAQLPMVVQGICSSPVLSNTSPRSPLLPLSALPSDRYLSQEICPTIRIRILGG